MKLVTLAPIAALAFTVAAPFAASAQTTDNFAILNAEVQRFHISYLQLHARVDRCQGVDWDEVGHLQATANDLSRRAARLANEAPGNGRALVLSLQRTAESDYWNLANLTEPDICYTPPSE